MSEPDDASVTPGPTSIDDSVDVAVRAAQIADEKKATDVVVLDVGDVLSITGYFVIASAPNQRLVRTVAEEIEAGIRDEFDRAPVRTEGVREQQWILVDYGDVVVHVFHETQREFYAIERLYGDVPRVPWRSSADGQPSGQGADESLSSGDDDR